MTLVAALPPLGCFSFAGGVPAEPFFVAAASGDRALRHWASQTGSAPATIIRDAISRIGRDPARLTVSDIDFLSPLDEFHCLGTQATVDLARGARIGPGARVLDLGSGIGGPSRRLAAEFGCEVVGLDITRSYVEAASELTERLGLSGHVAHYLGDAVDLPFPRRSFDFVWMQVASANIFDRARLYREISRVLRLGGCVAFFEMLAGPGGSLHFPVPWALDKSTNALLTPSAKEAALAAEGLRIRFFQDVSDEAAAWFHRETVANRLPNMLRRLGFQLLLPDWPRMAYNQWRNMVERRLFFTYIIAEHA
jgi:SAM-dependent methyltransferase